MRGQNRALKSFWRRFRRFNPTQMTASTRAHKGLNPRPLFQHFLWSRLEARWAVVWETTAQSSCNTFKAGSPLAAAPFSQFFFFKPVPLPFIQPQGRASQTLWQYKRGCTEGFKEGGKTKVKWSSACTKRRGRTVGGRGINQIEASGLQFNLSVRPLVTLRRE